MKNGISSQIAESPETGKRAAPDALATRERLAADGAETGKPVAPDASATKEGSATQLVFSPSTAKRRKAARKPAASARPSKGAAGGEKPASAEGIRAKNEVKALPDELEQLVKTMLTEGSTFEDIVEAVEEHGDRITLNAVQNFFQGNRILQKSRVRHTMDTAAALLETIGNNPNSAEAELARATFMTGYLRVHRDGALITARDAERQRMTNENLRLKHQILMMQRKKASQDLDYSKMRTNLLSLTQDKMREQIAILRQEMLEHRRGAPMGPEMLGRIQQLYGLACQPLLGEEGADASAKA